MSVLWPLIEPQIRGSMSREKLNRASIFPNLYAAGYMEERNMDCVGMRVILYSIILTYLIGYFFYSKQYLGTYLPAIHTLLVIWKSAEYGQGSDEGN